jgi:uncharacterized protein YegL
MQTIKNLLALGISIGLTDRETFVKKVSGLIEDYQKDPEKAEQISQGIVNFLEEMKEDFRLQRNMRSAISDSLPKENIHELVKAMQELTKELQQQKKG